jgi:hypothetical protein
VVTGLGAPFNSLQYMGLHHRLWHVPVSLTMSRFFRTPHLLFCGSEALRCSFSLSSAHFWSRSRRWVLQADLDCGCSTQSVGIFMASVCDRFWQLFLAQGLCMGHNCGVAAMACRTPTLHLSAGCPCLIATSNAGLLATKRAFDLAEP